MFTGIIEEVGQVVAVTGRGGHTRLEVACDQVLADAQVGGSIAVDGCCLTITALRHGRFSADLMTETLHATTLGELATGDPVNLERPLKADGRLGGHLVQGHVDGVGAVTGRDEQPGMLLLSIGAPAALAPYLASKGSVAVQGVSLTVIDVDGAVFRLGLIPHTRAATTLARLRVGDGVNLEADVLARYVRQLLRTEERLDA